MRTARSGAGRPVDRIIGLLTLRTPTRVVCRHARPSGPPGLIAEFLGARQGSAVVKKLLQRRDQPAQKRDERLLKKAAEQAANLSIELQGLHGIVKGRRQHCGAEGHDLPRCPARTQHAHLSAERRQIIDEPVFRLGDDVRNRKPIFKSVRVDKRQRIGCVGLFALLPLVDQDRARPRIRDMVEHLAARRSCHLLSASLDHVERFEERALAGVGARIAREHDQLFRRAIKKSLVQRRQCARRKPVHPSDDIVAHCLVDAPAAGVHRSVTRTALRTGRPLLAGVVFQSTERAQSHAASQVNAKGVVRRAFDNGCQTIGLTALASDRHREEDENLILYLRANVRVLRRRSFQQHAVAAEVTNHTGPAAPPRKLSDGVELDGNPGIAAVRYRAHRPPPLNGATTPGLMPIAVLARRDSRRERSAAQGVSPAPNAGA